MMIWSCENCGYESSVGLVVDLRPGDHADCPHCHGIMEVTEEQHQEQRQPVLT